VTFLSKDELEKCRYYAPMPKTDALNLWNVGEVSVEDLRQIMAIIASECGLKFSKDPVTGLVYMEKCR
jgi:hypothetical protein